MFCLSLRHYTTGAKAMLDERRFYKLLKEADLLSTGTSVGTTSSFTLA